MNSAEDDLEAALWSALTRNKVTCDQARELMEDLMKAAVAYAAADSEALTAARRMVLHEATAPGPRQIPGSVAGESVEVTAPELFPPGSSASVQRGAVGGATLSTGQSVPVASQARVNSHPQAVHNRRALAVAARLAEEPTPDVDAGVGS